MTVFLLHDVYRADPSESGYRGALADRYKLGLPEFTGVLDAISRGTALRAAAITVDDGGVSFATVIADALEAKGWRGHAFACTGQIGRRGFLNSRDIRDLDVRGHLIGSHSATHPTRFSACSWAQMLAEWRDSRHELEDVLGHAVHTASLPGGYLSRRVAAAAAEAGLRTLYTSEPVRRRRLVDGCELIGRVTVRPGVSLAELTALAAGARWPLARRRAVWSAKKMVKPLLGAAYPRLGELLVRLVHRPDLQVRPRT
jgi:peptidoglycan/xylan/chitin deacetylase (PgdA/CDA1 family)